MDFEIFFLRFSFARYIFGNDTILTPNQGKKILVDKLYCLAFLTQSLCIERKKLETPPSMKTDR